jgi:streptogramin lyase
MPHGVSVDTEGNLWLTDVGMHQVGTKNKQIFFNQ